MTAMERLWALARHVDAPLTEGSWPERVRGKHCADTIQDLSHEISHFLIAAPWRRRKPHFGLGDPHRNRGLIVGYGLAAREEARASLLGAIMLATMGLRAEAKEELLEHGWTRLSNDSPRKHIWPEVDEGEAALAVIMDLASRRLVSEPTLPLGYEVDVPWRYTGPGAALLTDGNRR